ncbi:hypothetical protein CBR_g54316 [Chara braunii]|uniref:DUF7895 domain-containing protein n=1 Tax=Chara braunii TaxID=69332 RepID=A0A388MBX4_CHABU|nr:hypothetical protein CBR_g54316 [Chara braunii]|eukprot:GBG92061.1 hypothetical protein CBR_g54316 [Chara braunii]
MATTRVAVLPSSLPLGQSCHSSSRVHQPERRGPPHGLGSSPGLTVRCRRTLPGLQRRLWEKRCLSTAPESCALLFRRCPSEFIGLYFCERNEKRYEEHPVSSSCSPRRNPSSSPAHSHHKSNYSSAMRSRLGKHGVRASAASRIGAQGGQRGGREGGGGERVGGGGGEKDLGHNKLSALQADVCRPDISTRATSTAVTVVVVAGLVAAAAAALRNETVTNGESLQKNEQALPKCESCQGSGVCADCNGEGFLVQKLSKEQAERARKNSATAATRFTAGLGKKWKYCPSCSGGRICVACRGTGYV